jgi:NADPH:quinone reductase-like Zn-dependent oxidoreductase
MRALRFQHFGAPEQVLAVETLACPKARADEVLIEIAAGGITNVQGGI